MNNAVAGFSKLSKEEKINWIAQEYFSNPTEAITTIKQYWNDDARLQQLHDSGWNTIAIAGHTYLQPAGIICAQLKPQH